MVLLALTAPLRRLAVVDVRRRRPRSVVLAMAVNRWLLPALTGWSAGPRVVRHRRACTASRRRRSGRAAAAARRSRICWTPRRCSSAGCGRCGTAAAGPSPTAVAHRGAPGRAGAAQRAPTARASVLLAAALLCAAAAGAGLQAVYRHERAVEQARAADRRAGSPDRRADAELRRRRRCTDDFARAQALATDGYRPQLIAQQQAVQKAGATANEYWAVSSAVLIGDAGRGGDAVGAAGPARRRTRTT